MKTDVKITLFLGLLFALNGFGQTVDTLQLRLPQAEGILLKNNLSLLAEELNLDKAEAEIIQAKVWSNPTLSIDNFNPFTTSYQRRHAEEQASLFGSQHFGKYRQIEVQLEQVFSLAGRRKKQKAIAEVSADEAAAYLADFLLELKTEFRKTIYEFIFQQRYLETLRNQEKALEELIEAYQNQYKKGNINKMELMWLQASQFQLHTDCLTLKTELDHLQGELIVAMNLSESTILRFEEGDILEKSTPVQSYTLEEIWALALENRPDLKLSDVLKDRADKEYDYEKSERIPDLGISVSYDRGGGIYPDFVGIGVAIDLPFSNPNKGNIKKAEIQIKQRQFEHEQTLRKAKIEVENSYKKVQNLLRLLQGVDADYLTDLDKMMAAYTRYFKERNINITTYMDFLEAYLDNQKTVYDGQKEYLKAIEDLKQVTGIELE